MWLVKLGGSLMMTPYLQSCLELLLEQGQGRILIIPGGGIFADNVRKAQSHWGLSDRAAHYMALCAMEQYAYYCQSILPEMKLATSLSEVKSLLADNKLVSFLPRLFLSAQKHLHENWSFSADSISAHLAYEFEAKGLILIKSTEVKPKYTDYKELVTQGIIDPLFPKFAEKLDCPVYFFAANERIDLSSVMN